VSTGNSKTTAVISMLNDCVILFRHAGEAALISRFSLPGTKVQRNEKASYLSRGARRRLPPVVASTCGAWVLEERPPPHFVLLL